MNKTKLSISKSYYEFVKNYNTFIDAIGERLLDRPDGTPLTEGEKRKTDEIRNSTVVIRQTLDAIIQSLRELQWWDEEEREPAKRKFKNTTHETLCNPKTINKN